MPIFSSSHSSPRRNECRIPTFSRSSLALITSALSGSESSWTRTSPGCSLSELPASRSWGWGFWSSCSPWTKSDMVERLEVNSSGDNWRMEKGQSIQETLHPKENATGPSTYVPLVQISRRRTRVAEVTQLHRIRPGKARSSISLVKLCATR